MSLLPDRGRRRSARPYFNPEWPARAAERSISCTRSGAASSVHRPRSARRSRATKTPRAAGIRRSRLQKPAGGAAVRVRQPAGPARRPRHTPDDREIQRNLRPVKPGASCRETSPSGQRAETPASALTCVRLRSVSLRRSGRRGRVPRRVLSHSSADSECVRAVGRRTPPLLAPHRCRHRHRRPTANDCRPPARQLLPITTRWQARQRQRLGTSHRSVRPAHERCSLQSRPACR